MHHLRSAGYLAAINTEIQDYHSQVSVTRAELMQPALLCYEGFPMFSRRKPEDGIVNFAVDAFLGKPSLVVLHHEFFRTGFSAFEELVQRISGLHPRLAWTNLENIVKETDLSRIDSRGPGVVERFTNRHSGSAAFQRVVDRTITDRRSPLCLRIPRQLSGAIEEPIPRRGSSSLRC